MKWFEDLNISLTEKDFEELFLPFNPARRKSVSVRSLTPPTKNKERLIARIYLRLSRKNK